VGRERGWWRSLRRRLGRFVGVVKEVRMVLVGFTMRPWISPMVW
jgi:hypothetical protein